MLCAAEGLNNTEIAARLGIAVSSGGKWRNRFAEHRLDGLVDDPRPGRPRTITDDKVEEMIIKTLETTRADATRWVDAVDGPRDRADAVGGAAELARVRAAAPPPADVEALQGPTVHRQGPRRRPGWI
jgi:Winged helix-turn helix